MSINVLILCGYFFTLSIKIKEKNIMAESVFRIKGVGLISCNIRFLLLFLACEMHSAVDQLHTHRSVC